MGLIRAIAACCAMFLVSDAFIDFDSSRLYDEKDFEGQGTVYVSNFCSEGCDIYVSIPEDSAEVAKKIFIDDFTGQQINLFDANVKDDDNHKIPHVVPKGNAQVNFINQNANQKSAPIAVWIVRGDAPNIDIAEVYDADGTTRAAAPAKVITILDAEPFTVSTFTNGKILPYNAITAGFDALDSPDKCTRVIQEDTQDLRGLMVRSPLFTIEFQPSETEIAMLAVKGSISAFDLTNMMYVSSPEYIGCYTTDGNGATKTFRSSLYGTKSEFEIASDDPVPVRIFGDLYVDGGHPVEILIDNQSGIAWDSTQSGYPQASLTAKDLKISWTRNDANLDMFFMVRLEPDVAVEKPDPEPEKTTTARPEGLVCNSVTMRWEWADGSAIDYKPPHISGDLDGACQTGCTWILDNYVWVEGCNHDVFYPDVFCIKQLSQPVPTECNSFAEDSDDRVCYQVGATAESWQEAQMSCKSVGADVASIHNSQENSFVRRLAVSNGAVNGLFLGASISGKGNEFGWIDGSAWDYQNFSPGFPMAGFGECLAMDTSSSAGQWMNRDCSSKLPVACSRKESNFTVPEPTCTTGPWQENGIITSPGYPFSAALPCEYFLTVEKGQVVEAEILSLEANSCCDRLIIYDDYLGGNVIANLTGAVSNVVYTSNTNFMRVSWQPNGGVNVKGLAMVFRGV